MSYGDNTLFIVHGDLRGIPGHLTAQGNQYLTTDNAARVNRNGKLWLHATLEYYSREGDSRRLPLLTVDQFLALRRLANGCIHPNAEFPQDVPTVEAEYRRQQLNDTQTHRPGLEGSSVEIYSQAFKERLRGCF